MYPEALQFPPIIVIAPVAVLIGWASALWLAGNADIPRPALVCFLLLLAVSAFAGAKGYSLFERGATLSPRQELLVGYRYPGGIIALLLFAPVLWFVFLRGIRLLAVLDCIAPGIALAMAVVRLNCLALGCCAGTVCSLPWCVTFPNGSPSWQEHFEAGLLPTAEGASLPVHPLQVYFMAASLAVGLFLSWFHRRRSYDGQVLLLFLLLHETSKFLLESLRVPYNARLQLVALALAVVAGAALLIRRSARPLAPVSR